MKKLLLIGPGSVHTYNYYKLIEKFFDEILVITNTSRPEFDSIRTVKSDFSIRNPLQAIRNIKVIRRHIKKFKPNVIHVHQANSIAYLSIRANKNTGIPVIVTAWGSDVLIAPERGILIKKMIFCFFSITCYNQFPISLFLLDELIERPDDIIYPV